MCCWKLSEQRFRSSDGRILDLHDRHKAECLGTERRSLEPLSLSCPSPNFFLYPSKESFAQR